MGKFKDGLKAYLNLIKLSYNINNKRMIEIEKQVEYLDDEIRKILKNYPNGKIEMFSFIIYIAYLLSAVIDEDELLESFIKILRELYNAKKEP
jgi:hypothetical protein